VVGPRGRKKTGSPQKVMELGKKKGSRPRKQVSCAGKGVSIPVAAAMFQKKEWGGGEGLGERCACAKVPGPTHVLNVAEILTSFQGHAEWAMAMEENYNARGGGPWMPWGNSPEGNSIGEGNDLGEGAQKKKRNKSSKKQNGGSAPDELGVLKDTQFFQKKKGVGCKKTKPRMATTRQNRGRRCQGGMLGPMHVFEKTSGRAVQELVSTERGRRLKKNLERRGGMWEKWQRTLGTV